MTNDDLETVEVVYILAQERDPDDRSGSDLLCQLGHVALLTLRDSQKVGEIATELSIGERVQRIGRPSLP